MIVGLFSAGRVANGGHAGYDMLMTAHASSQTPLESTTPKVNDTQDPFRTWIIQLVVIIIVTQLLGLGLRKIRQPRVIAEVLGGILLGPTAFGRIPGFTEAVFPALSRPFLSLTANIGLCLFLFIVGLEIDLAVVKKNSRLSTSVALAGMVLPFGLGAALSVPIYRQFVDPSIEFTHFMLFTSVAFSITAFPVLCRILTELKLLDTTVGIVVLSAGVGNDIVGWTLLALSVALVNASSGLTALYILLISLAWTVFLLFPVKWVVCQVARMTGSIENGPSIFFLTVAFLVTFVSAFVTDTIGVHAIFGAFLAGITIPRDGGLAIALTERMEDMVSVVFLPLYFTLSGLSTDLGLLDDATTWAFTACICILAFVGKFSGCTLAARYAAGFTWREACAVGGLMSCKGLVELIVLNVGLSAGILSQRIFSMFVVEAMLLTFITTPLVTTLYPVSIRSHASAMEEDAVEDDEDAKNNHSQHETGSHMFRSAYTVPLNKLEHLPAIMAMSQLLRPSPRTFYPHSRKNSSLSTLSSNTITQTVNVDALRLIELSDRASMVMKYSVSDSLLSIDPILSAFRMHGRLNDLEVHPFLKVVPEEDLASTVTDHARQAGSDMILLPWTPVMGVPNDENIPISHPLNTLLRTTESTSINSQFIRSVFGHATTNVALFIDQTPSECPPNLTGRVHHLFVPFFGGPDDRLALEFAVHLCRMNVDVSVTAIRYIKRDLEADPPTPSDEAGAENPLLVDLPLAQTKPEPDEAPYPDTIYDTTTPERLTVSASADKLLWERYRSLVSGPGDGASTSSASTVYTSRIELAEESSATPLAAINERAIRLRSHRRTRTLIVTGRSRRLAVENHEDELQHIFKKHDGKYLSDEVRKTVGDVATACMAFSPRACGLVVIQASASTMMG